MESSSLRVDESSVSSWDQTTDVLIIGGGCAGACAALAAAEQGAEVRIVERAGGAGGTSALSGGILYLGGGTPIRGEDGGMPIGGGAAAGERRAAMCKVETAARSHLALTPCEQERSRRERRRGGCAATLGTVLGDRRAPRAGGECIGRK